MDIEALQWFFFWCMVVNFGIYALTAILVLGLRGLVCRLLGWMFGVDEQWARKATLMYLSGFKLLIAVFNFAPWIALLIIE
jgi:hypothetical protein